MSPKGKKGKTITPNAPTPPSDDEDMEAAKPAKAKAWSAEMVALAAHLRTVPEKLEETGVKHLFNFKESSFLILENEHFFDYTGPKAMSYLDPENGTRWNVYMNPDEEKVKTFLKGRK